MSEPETKLEHAFLIGFTPSALLGAAMLFHADPLFLTTYFLFSTFLGPIVMAFLIRFRIGPFVGFWRIWMGSASIGLVFSLLVFLVLVLAELLQCGGGC